MMFCPAWPISSEKRLIAPGVPADGDAHRLVRRRALVEHLEFDGLALADDAEAGGAADHHLAVALVVAAGDQRVQRRAAEGRVGGQRHVVHLAVGQHHDGAEPLRRDVGERRAERGEELRAVDRDRAGLATGLDGADLDVAQVAEPFLQRVARGLGGGGAASEILAGALVDDDGDDRRQRLAVLGQEHGPGEGGDQRRQRGEAQPGAANPPEDERGDGEKADDREPGEPGERDQRREGQGPVHRVAPLTARAVRAGPARAPGRPCSCRSACT